MKKKELLIELKALLKKVQIDPNSKYLSAKGIEAEYGISHKTVLNRSNLHPNHRRYIPSVRLKGGRKKLFERKVIERILKVGRSEQYTKKYSQNFNQSNSNQKK